jgi:hypothetical protein
VAPPSAPGALPRSLFFAVPLVAVSVLAVITHAPQ